MKKLRRKLTYANVTSTVCLCLLVGGGTAFAATQMLPKNSVGAKQIKKGAITPAKLSRSTKAKFTGAGLTGPMGPAGPAGAPGAPGAASEQIKTWFAKASVGETVTLLTIGPFTYKGECIEEGGGPYAQTFAETSQAGSYADSYADEDGYETHSSEQNPWDPGHPVSIGYYSQEHATDGHPGWVGPYDGSDTQLSADGHTYVNTFAAVGTEALGADCVFVGHAVVDTQ